MRRVIVAIAILAAAAGDAVAQGMYPLNPSVTVNQQRTNPYTVSPNAPTQTYPSGSTFQSPFVSPFTTTGASYPPRSGYAGSGSQ
ncbi:hypothetical protein JQ557_01480 [Bradyrhizobium sp. U87765 SZCCT0131]|uniref:hypothetical protein n=1 Tax=unclassified Bradyrhizobium TaxID=2631580 RepID=UPI001BA4652F|nr:MULTISPECIES: hypothetical protein [unclassified Bradyrhizobium]MBR1216645.1 hypothetical protein [Bradyrhizobium sp. U87765 SZCCT0131]MBR1259599.1 hypothetical protein [Bradyrhizobium sp. U87765 SZCCT0134]MBR1305740.1 hypothetical protein [Bradyrhizobium sp. U87765 SZCCT0110]MBR1322107.1 hypothetical protein [Bradyrhizobium sp. U87765 SZCCT0109]MBR1350615.1 hypothetical protein [Bradyrhizobium sp. U87765 SZCCT0048]